MTSCPPRRPLLIAPLFLVTSFAVVACGPADSTVESGLAPVALSSDQAATLPVFHDDPSRSNLEVVFQSIHVLDDAGSVVSSEQEGSLTLEDWQRAARPWTHLAEPFVYHEEAWERPRGDGTTESGYRIVRTPN